MAVPSQPGNTDSPLFAFALSYASFFHNARAERGFFLSFLTVGALTSPAGGAIISLVKTQGSRYG